MRKTEYSPTSCLKIIKDIRKETNVIIIVAIRNCQGVFKLSFTLIIDSTTIKLYWCEKFYSFKPRKEFMEKKAAVLILILILFMSSIAYHSTLVFQTPEVELPKEKVLSRISEAQRDILLRDGYTLIYYNYTSEDEIKRYLEYFVSKNDAYLIGNNVGNLSEDFLKVESLKGSREMKDPSLNDTIDLICEIITYPPLECTLREIE